MPQPSLHVKLCVPSQAFQLPAVKKRLRCLRISGRFQLIRNLKDHLRTCFLRNERCQILQGDITAARRDVVGFPAVSQKQNGQKARNRTMSSRSTPFRMNWEIAFVSLISMDGPNDLVNLGTTTSSSFCRI